MGEHIDKATGKLKQAAGDLSDDQRLKREGTRDELAGKAHGVVEDLKDKAQDAVDSAKEKINDALSRD